MLETCAIVRRGTRAPPDPGRPAREVPLTPAIFAMNVGARPGPSARARAGIPRVVSGDRPEQLQGDEDALNDDSAEDAAGSRCATCAPTYPRRAPATAMNAASGSRAVLTRGSRSRRSLMNLAKSTFRRLARCRPSGRKMPTAVTVRITIPAPK